MKKLNKKVTIMSLIAIAVMVAIVAIILLFNSNRINNVIPDF